MATTFITLNQIKNYKALSYLTYTGWTRTILSTLAVGSTRNKIIKRSLHRGLPKLVTVPVKCYDNPEIQKSIILEENKNKSLIYRWINKINNKDYLGSSGNAHIRFAKYYDKFILQNMNMSIYKALLKYGHCNFILQIIEFCEPKHVIAREQFYLDNFDFDYNQLSKADSSLGYRHSTETLAKMKGRKNALGFKHKAETKEKLSKISAMYQHNEDSLLKMRENWALRKLKTEVKHNSVSLGPQNLDSICSAQKRKAPHSKKVIVKNIENDQFKIYESITEASISLNLNRSTLRNYINKQCVFTVLTQDVEKVTTQKELFLIDWA